MFTIPLAAKIGVGAGAGLLLLASASPAAFASAPPAARVAASPAATAGPSTTSDRRADRRVLVTAYLEASATVLGMSDKELHAALKAGKSLQDLATAKGLTKDAFADRVAKAIAPLLDKAVDAKKITREQATRFEKRLAAGRLPLWTREHRPKA